MRKALGLASLLTLLLAPAAPAEPGTAAVDPGLLSAAGCGAAPNVTAADDGSTALMELGLFAPARQPMLPPMCPTPVSCPSGCDLSRLCTVEDLGPCCTKP